MMFCVLKGNIAKTENVNLDVIIRQVVRSMNIVIYQIMLVKSKVAVRPAIVILVHFAMQLLANAKTILHVQVHHVDQVNIAILRVVDVYLNA
jgi:hypothetical protein